jgi:hypothetical protein
VSSESNTTHWPAWQPIETAPKDGTRIIGYGTITREITGSVHGPEIAVIQWINDGLNEEWQIAEAEYYSPSMNATHWMPLPPPH